MRRNKDVFIGFILFSIEIYARKMFPIFSLRKRFLRCHDHLIDIKYTQYLLRIVKIQFCKDIIEEENNGKIDIFSQKKDFDLLECQEEDLVLSS